MAKNVKKFVNRDFAKTVDLDLLKRLIDPYAATIQLDWNALPADEKDRREAIFEFFRGLVEREWRSATPRVGRSGRGGHHPT
jgi:hypothetical protein